MTEHRHIFLVALHNLLIAIHPSRKSHVTLATRATCCTKKEASRLPYRDQGGHMLSIKALRRRCWDLHAMFTRNWSKELMIMSTTLLGTELAINCGCLHCCAPCGTDPSVISSKVDAIATLLLLAPPHTVSVDHLVDFSCSIFRPRRFRFTVQELYNIVLKSRKWWLQKGHWGMGMVI